MVALLGSSTGPLLAQAFAFQLDAVGIVDEPIQDGVGQRWVADDVVPAVDRHLAGDDQRPGVVAVFDDLQQVALLFSNQRLRMSISVEKLPGNSVQKFPLHQAVFGCFLRCLKRNESFPVSRMSQWWVTRSSRAVVILGSPKTPTHSAKERLVVTISEVFS